MLFILLVYFSVKTLRCLVRDVADVCHFRDVIIIIWSVSWLPYKRNFLMLFDWSKVSYVFSTLAR